MIELSVIIPSYNRAAQVRAGVLSLAVQNFDARAFEVIVVVDGSRDDTATQLAALETPFALRVHTQPNRGASVARNQGAALARGRYCLFIDDDVVADPELLRAHVTAQQAQGGALVLGAIETQIAPDADWFARCYAREWAEHYAELETRAPIWTDCYTGNLSLPREIFAAVGGFATDLRRNEDIELGYRLKARGVPFVYAPAARVTQHHRKGFADLRADIEHSGATAFEIYRRHPAALPDQLGGYGLTTRRNSVLRQLVLALRVPARLLYLLGKFFAHAPSIWEWYLFVYGCIYWRGVKRAAPAETWRRLTSGTVILMYHAFAKHGERTSRYIVSARSFARQMRWLKWLRYRVISLEEYARLRAAFALPPPRSVVITMDDGYADNYACAWPVLRAHQWPATLFAVSGGLGRANEWDGAKDAHLERRPLLSCAQLRAMHAGGIQIGAHTRTHRALTILACDEAYEEMAGSRAELEALLAAPVPTFSYPYGLLNESLQAAAARIGFACACGVEAGKNYAATPLHNLRRVEIRGHYTLLDFATSVWLGGHR